MSSEFAEPNFSMGTDGLGFGVYPNPKKKLLLKNLRLLCYEELIIFSSFLIIAFFSAFVESEVILRDINLDVSGCVLLIKVC